MQEIRTRSPGLNAVTPGPISSTMPTPSWPRMRPGAQVGTSPLRMCRSVPQIVVLVILTMASVGRRCAASAGLPAPSYRVPDRRALSCPLLVGILAGGDKLAEALAGQVDVDQSSTPLDAGQCRLAPPRAFLYFFALARFAPYRSLFRDPQVLRPAAAAGLTAMQRAVRFRTTPAAAARRLAARRRQPRFTHYDPNQRRGAAGPLGE